MKKCRTNQNNMMAMAKGFLTLTHLKIPQEYRCIGIVRGEGLHAPILIKC